MMIHSNEAANILMKFGIQKGDRVLLMLPRVPEWWILVLGIMKRGAVFCPSPHMLTVKDIAYRMKVGSFKMVITDSENMDKVDEVAADCPNLQLRMIVDDKPGKRLETPWIGYQNELLYPAPVSTKLVSSVGRRMLATDPMLIYFTSGTTKDPKMVLHDYGHPLGQTVTAKFWHDLTEYEVHFTVSDTGWAKCGWGKIYGQWICGACIFVYDYRTKFHATELLPLIERYGITSFCAPPTIYRMLMIIAELKKFSFSELRTCTSAGEPLNPEVIRIWKEGTGLTIREGYGVRPRPAAVLQRCPVWRSSRVRWENRFPAGTFSSMTMTETRFRRVRPAESLSRSVQDPQVSYPRVPRQPRGERGDVRQRLVLHR